jgi:hypothetical protein
MLVLVVPVDLHKLLEDSGPATTALNSKSRRVMEVTEDPSIVLIVAVLRTKDCRAYRTSEVLHMELLAQGSNIAASKSSTTGCTKEVKPPEIVGLAEGEELLRHPLHVGGPASLFLFACSLG